VTPSGSHAWVAIARPTPNTAATNVLTIARKA
jgi:hypothetical protein